MGKKNVGKKGEKTFFYIQTNIVTNKRGGGNARKKFSETHEECDQKCLEKIVGKKGEKVFYFHTNIITKNAGKKGLETIFSETHE